MLPLQPITPNYITRAHKQHKHEEVHGQNEGEPVDQFDMNDVHECEEIAEELQFLSGGKFIVEGKVHQIFQVRYDPEFKGFR